MTDHTIGVDISKSHLDVFRLEDRTAQRFDNSAVGFRALTEWLGKAPVESPRVYRRVIYSNVTQLFDFGSSFHRMPPLLLGAGHSRWHCAVVLSCTS